MSKRYGGVEGDLDGPAFSKKELGIISSFKTAIEARPSYVSELRKNAKFVTEDGKEICVLCGTVTDVNFETPVDARQHYINGQHCVQCCQKYKLC